MGRGVNGRWDPGRADGQPSFLARRQRGRQKASKEKEKNTKRILQKCVKTKDRGGEGGWKGKTYIKLELFHKARRKKGAKWGEFGCTVSGRNCGQKKDEKKK